MTAEGLDALLTCHRHRREERDAVREPRQHGPARLARVPRDDELRRQRSRPWALAEADAEPIIRRAVEGGITFFDTADVYNGGESEVVTGRVLPKLLSREELVVATKVHGRTMPGENGRGLSRKHVLASIDARCSGSGWTTSTCTRSTAGIPLTPIAETMEALHDVVKAGKARYIGASSMFAWQFAKAQATADRHGTTRFVSMQNHDNLVYREEEREMIPQCVDQGVAVLPWSPLARGLLAGNRTRDGERLTMRAGSDPFGDSLYVPEIDFDVVDRVNEVAAERGVSGAQVALAWVLGRPGVTAPIVGATSVGHVEDALAAEELELTADEAEPARGAVRAARRLRTRMIRGATFDAALQPRVGRTYPLAP